MKTILTILMLIALAFMFVSISTAQSPPDGVPPASCLPGLVDENGTCLLPFGHPPMQPLPEMFASHLALKLTLANLVDILSEYEVRHVVGLPRGSMPYYGLTDNSTKTIFIVGGSTRGEVKKTIIHEAYHILYDWQGLPQPPESIIAISEEQTYRDLFTKDGSR